MKHRITRQEIEAIKALPAVYGSFERTIVDVTAATTYRGHCALGKLPMIVNRPEETGSMLLMEYFPRSADWQYIAGVNDGKIYGETLHRLAIDMVVDALVENGHLEIIEDTPELTVPECGVAQQVERLAVNETVASSNLATTAIV